MNQASLEQPNPGTSAEQPQPGSSAGSQRNRTTEVLHKKNIKVQRVQQNGKSVYQCIVCSLISPRHYNAVRHHDRFHCPTYSRQCKHCDEKFLTKGRMYEHLHDKHGISNTYIKMLLKNKISEEDPNNLQQNNLTRNNLLEDYGGTIRQQRPPLQCIENINSHENETK